MLKKSNRFETALQYLKASFIIRMLTERKKALLRQTYLKARAFWGLGMTQRAQRGFVIALFLAEQLSDNGKYSWRFSPLFLRRIRLASLS